MTWDPQRQAYTPGVSRPMPGPGDLWGSPEDDATRACELDDVAACLHGAECVNDECGRYSTLMEDIDELINLAAPYADAPANNDLSLHDDHLHQPWTRDRKGTIRRPWWRHQGRLQHLWRGFSGVLFVTLAVRPCGPDDRETGEGELTDIGAWAFRPTPSSVVFEGGWRHRALYHLHQHDATTNTKHWRRASIRPCSGTESGLAIGGKWSRP